LNRYGFFTGLLYTAVCPKFQITLIAEWFANNLSEKYTLPALSVATPNPPLIGIISAPVSKTGKAEDGFELS